LLKITRSNVYYKSRRIADKYGSITNNINSKINDLWSKYSFLGYRKITAILRTQEGLRINHKKVLGLMRDMGLKAVYAKPRTTIIDKNNNHNKFPYLLKNMEINQVNQVWSTDITYIKMPKGFVYLVALIDVYSRFVVSWKLSICMDTEFCLDILNQGLELYKPSIINTDQGSQFTSNDWINCLTGNDIKISMDGVGRWADNIYIERFWRTIKQEQIYIEPPENVGELRNKISKFIDFYNYQRLR
jgi:putative transposase